MKPEPQFRMKLSFHFNEHGEDRRRWFMFGEDRVRRVLMQIEEVDGLNTVGMYIDEPKTFHQGDEYEVDCVVLSPELFKDKIVIGSKGQLWDGGFFTNIQITKVYDSGWPESL